MAASLSPARIPCPSLRRPAASSAPPPRADAPRRGPRRRAPRVHTMAVCAAGAIEHHPATDGVRISFKRVLCRRPLGGKKAPAHHAQHRDREHQAKPSHKRLLLFQWRVYTTFRRSALRKTSYAMEAGSTKICQKKKLTEERHCFLSNPDHSFPADHEETGQLWRSKRSTVSQSPVEPRAIPAFAQSA